ncbi:hypothetical protein PRIPAC_97122 [Pristionchus pacificus]|nr:hypothetical protein PRIPAC_97122 [Pristionchus pacificus]
MKDRQHFLEGLISAHNTRRLLHGSPPLRWSEELAHSAQIWAEKLAKQAHITYCELSGVGENITFFPPSIDPETAVEHWYAEHEKYEFETPGWQNGTNYFTQVVWRATEEIGIGVARVNLLNDSNENVGSIPNSKSRTYTLAQDGEIVVVAFYRPSGNNNRAGQFNVNVRKPVQLTKPSI